MDRVAEAFTRGEVAQCAELRTNGIQIHDSGDRLLAYFDYNNVRHSDDYGAIPTILIRDVDRGEATYCAVQTAIRESGWMPSSETKRVGGDADPFRRWAPSFR